MENIKTKVACYYRFSRDGQSNYSIEAQQRACRAYCDANHYEIVKEYKDEGCSASKNISKREEFLEMIDDAKKKKFEIIVVHKIDRFSRGDDYETAFYKHLLKQAGVKRESVTEQGIDDSPEGEVMEKMLELIAHYFSRNLSRESKKGQYENALKGKHNGGLAPLGYSVNQQGDYILNQTEAEIVKKIFEMFLQGYGYDKIAQAFPGFRTKKNKPLGKGSIHDILKNEKYTGVYIYNQSWVKGANGKMSNRIKKPLDEQVRIEGGMPVIIDRATWLEVQKKLEQRKNNSGSYKKSNYTYLLSNILFCGHCGSKLGGTCCNKKNIKDGQFIYYYECGGYKRHKNCIIKKVRADALETNVINYLKINFTKKNIDLLKKYVDINLETINKQNSIKCTKLKQSLSALSIKIDNVTNLLIDTPSQALKQKLVDFENEKAVIQKQINVLSNKNLEVHIKKECLAYLNKLQNFENLERKQQKQIIENFIEKVEVFKNDDKGYMVKIKTSIGNALNIPMLDNLVPSSNQVQFGSPKGNRTPDTTVKGWCLNRLTMGPQKGIFLCIHGNEYKVLP
mgnify:CR=1 FL=1